jgi:lon-related putative ATP-dependent protease
MAQQGLSPEQLYQRCDPDQFSFQSTKELELMQELGETVGQPRAVHALRFGTGIQREGYNIYALGPPGTGKHTLVDRVLREQAKQSPTPNDWCYVNNFEDSTKPKILRLPAGWGNELAEDMRNLVEEAPNALKSAFESEDYQNRRQAIEQELKDVQQKAFEELQQKAQEKGLTVMRTPSGLAFAYVKNGEIVSGEQFQQLPDEERQQVERDVQELQKESQRIFKNIPAWERQTREKLREMSREVATNAIDAMIEELREKYKDFDEVVEYLNAAEKDMVDNAPALLQPEGQQQQQQQQMMQQQQMGSSGQAGGQMAGMENPALRRYRVNVLVDNSEQEGGPVIYEDNPTYANLVGTVEYLPQMGALVTDYNLIKAGALHRANGGSLILDAHKVLMQPGAWEGLKRALKSGEIKIESLAQMFSLISTVSLEPEPVSLCVKVILVGSPLIYYLLRELDPDFAALFKVAADFDTQMSRNQESQELYARLIANVIHSEGLRHFERQAVARVVEHGSRMLGDGEKLSADIRGVTDIIREADYWAGQQDRETVAAEDVQQAIDAWTYRSNRLQERVQEEIHRGTLLIDTEGASIGQINGLSVLMLGEFLFGRPHRITARTRLGKGDVVDIEREAKLSGPIHSKGVLILSGFLGARYSQDSPLSLSASLVFEQSYSGIEGDSASSAELYALLSSIAEVPLKQSLAVTGSVNQHGQIQAIGGVNEKIEGFFDVCQARGLTGDQGVLIPASNVKHLMLRSDVIEAVKNGHFSVHPVETVDQGIELLTGMPAGEPDENNRYPEGTLNGLVQRKLRDLAEKRRSYAAESGQGGEREPRE